MGSEAFDWTAMGPMLLAFAREAMGNLIWVLLPFSVGYSLPLIASTRWSRAVVWALAADVLIMLVWPFSWPSAPYGLRDAAMPWIQALAYGLVLGGVVQALSLRRSFPQDIRRMIVIGGFATMPLFVAGLSAQHVWLDREPDAACLATLLTVNLDGQHYRVPNVPIVVIGGEYRETHPTAAWTVNQRLRHRCAQASNTVARSSPASFSIDFWRGHHVEMMKRICINPGPSPRWLGDVCGAMAQESPSKVHEALAAANLPLNLSISLQSETERSSLVLDEHGHKRRMPPGPSYKDLRETAKFNVYVSGAKPDASQVLYWIRKGVGEPSEFSCRKYGNKSFPAGLRCVTGYARGSNHVSYVFRALPGSEEETLARVDGRVQEVLRELAASGYHGP